MKIDEKWFEDYMIGSTRTTMGRTITEADIVMHAGQTGDFFPHHMDAEWTKTQPIGQRIAHGTLVLAVAVGMTAGDINPQAMSYGYDRIRFIKPVLIGDTITVTAEIVGMSDHARRPDTWGYLNERATVVNQRHEVVMVFTHLYLVNKRADSASHDLTG